MDLYYFMNNSQSIGTGYVLETLNPSPMNSSDLAQIQTCMDQLIEFCSGTSSSSGDVFQETLSKLDNQFKRLQNLAKDVGSFRVIGK